jgi:hypothetical protein
MCFDRNINGNRDDKFLECDYLLVQRCVKLTLKQNSNKKSQSKMGFAKQFFSLQPITGQLSN